jgi:hypothetical protein
VLAVSSTSADPHGHLTLLGIAAGAVVVAVTVLVAAGLRRREEPAGTALREALARTNAVACTVVSVVSMWLFARSAAAVLPGGARQGWGYLPAWVALVLGIASVAVVVWLARRRPVVDLERSVLVYVVGGALFFVLTSRLAPGVTVFHGFDDAQGLVGADLLTRGYFPWRDFLFIHGLFDDVLRSAAGFPLFGHTIWGAQAVTLAVWVPLCWVGLYFLAAWSGRGRSVTVLAVALPLLAMSPGWEGQTFSFVRWVGTPFVLLSLGAALGERSPVRRTVVMTVVLFADAVLVPEASLLVLAVAVVLVLSDLSRRTPEDSWVAALRRTWTFVVTGGLLTVAWAVFLYANGALGAFVDYFVLFVPDHDATAATPVTHSTVGFPRFVLVIAITFLLVVLLGNRIVTRKHLSERQWVLAAATIFAGLYVEKALGRWDRPHVLESIFGGLPMVVIGGAMLLSAADDQISARVRAGLASRPPALAAAVRPLSALLALACLPAVLHLAVDTPSHNKVALTSLRSDPRIGYDAEAGPVRRTAADLRAAMDELQPRGPVFDFSNSPGYVHFLLRREPANRFTNVSFALTPQSQKLLLDELRAGPPDLVVFDSGRLGASRWDHIGNDVRTYLVSQYLLDGWTPVRSVDGFLLMMPDKLVGHGAIPRPTRQETQGLYDSTPACSWGYSADYLSSTPSGHRLVLPLQPVGGGSSDGDRVSVARVPKGVDLADYALLDAQADTAIGDAHLTLSDRRTGGDGRAGSRAEIRFRALPFAGSHVAVRVGSCLQWHGYSGHRLYVTQHNGTPVTRLVLSGVRQ